MVLLGPPGSGKSTLAERLCNDFGYVCISPGELYKKEAALNTDFGIYARDNFWGKGNLCPDNMTNDLVKKYIAKNSNDNIVFDGYPRTITQAKFLDKCLNISYAIDIIINEDIVIGRMVKRGQIEHRIDDTKQVIRKRLQVYNENNISILEHYEHNNILHGCYGDGTKDNTLKQVRKILDR